jgi:hypothetical protein
VGTLNWSFALGKIVGSIEENGRLAKVFMGVPLVLMCILFPKFEGLDVALGFLVEEGIFYLISIFAVVAMVEKMTYKKRSRSGCTIDCKLFARFKTQTCFVY